MKKYIFLSVLAISIMLIISGCTNSKQNLDLQVKCSDEAAKVFK